MYPHVHCSTIYNSYYMETICVQTDEWIKMLWCKQTNPQTSIFSVLIPLWCFPPKPTLEQSLTSLNSNKNILDQWFGKRELCARSCHYPCELEKSFKLICTLSFVICKVRRLGSFDNNSGFIFCTDWLRRIRGGGRSWSRIIIFIIFWKGASSLFTDIQKSYFKIFL